MKLKHELKTLELDGLRGLRVAGRQEVNHLTMITLVRDQPLQVGTMLRGAGERGPFFRPYGVMYTNDGPHTHCLQTRLFMNPKHLGEAVAGMVPSGIAARARIHQLFMDHNPSKPRSVPFQAEGATSAINPFKRGSAWYRDTCARFEIADGQVGAMYLVNDRLVGVMVLPDPATYRQMHDFCLDEVLNHTWSVFAYHPTAEADRVEVKANQVANLDELKQRLLQDDRETNEILAFYAEHSLGTLLTGKGALVDECTTVPPGLRLIANTFITAPHPQRRRFMGDMIRTAGGDFCYFKSMAIDAKLTKMVALYEAIHAAGRQLPLLLKQKGWTLLTWRDRCRDAGCTYLDESGWLQR